MNITPQPLTSAAFAPFGEVLDTTGKPDVMINAGMCGRYHDRARLDFSDGTAGISIFDAQARALPHLVEMVERHPLGSQAFIPLSDVSYLVVVAPDADGAPGPLSAFLASPLQSINLHRNVWHGVLCPLDGTGIFAVIDRIGDGNNLQEHYFSDPQTVS